MFSKMVKFFVLLPFALIAAYLILMFGLAVFAYLFALAM